MYKISQISDLWLISNNLPSQNQLDPGSRRLIVNHLINDIHHKVTVEKILIDLQTIQNEPGTEGSVPVLPVEI